MQKKLTPINHFFAEASGWMLIVVMLLLIADVISRGMGTPLLGVAEVAVFVMVAVVYMGQGHCEEVHGHVRVDALLIRLPPRARQACNVFSHLVAVVTIALTLYAVTDNAIAAYLENEAVSGATPLPTFPVKFVMSGTLLLYLVQLCVNTAGEIRKFLAKQ